MTKIRNRRWLSLIRYFLMIAVMLTFLNANFSPSFAYENEIRSLSTAMADNIAKAGKKRIAVVDFTDLQGNITELGRFIAEELSVDLTMTAKGFEVIDRNHLNRILAEHKLSVSGIVDQKTVQKLGQIAGVDALITGSITPLERSIRVVCKVIATDTARVIGAGKGDIVKTKAIEELFGRGIETTSGIASLSPAKPKTLAKAEARDIIFEAKECKVSGQRAVCTIAVTNNTEKTRKFEINAHWTGGNRISLLVDEWGNQFPANGVRFGLEKDYSWFAEQRLPPHLPLNFTITYSDINPTAKVVTLILKCRDEWEHFDVVLRNIPLSR
jgi:TolB-like protein